MILAAARGAAPLLLLALVAAGCGRDSQSAEADALGPSTVQFAPTWSPDGSSIAFVGGAAPGSENPEAVVIVRADGTGLRRIGKDFEGLGTLAYSPRADELVLVDTGGELPGFERGEIYRLSASDGELTNLSNSPADDEDPAWSPDGERVAFSSNRAGNREVYVVGRDGQGLRRLTHNRTQEGWPAWSPDGRRLIVRRSQNEVESLLVVDVQSGRSRMLARFWPTERLNAADWRGQWTPNGRTVVTDIGARITLIDVASGKRRAVPLFGTGARTSPDGTRVLVDGYRPAKAACDICPPVAEAGLFLVDVTTGKPRKLFADRLRFAIDGTWSPDGRNLALVLVTGETSVDRGLFVARSDGTRLRQLVPRRPETSTTGGT